MIRAPAPAKINLALAVGPLQANGRHEVTTVLQRVDLCDRVDIEPAPRLEVTGFRYDTIVRGALVALTEAAGARRGWRVRLTKRIPIASGLGGGSSDAATALRLANELLPEPLDPQSLRALATSVGADVPFFLEPGPQLGEGDGSALSPLDLPQDYWVLLLLPRGAAKASTREIYEAFDRRGAAGGYSARRTALLTALTAVRRPRDLAALPPNDLAQSALADELRTLGAFRADVSGAGPTVYGLFHHRSAAESARRRFARRARTWLTVPAWYG